MARKSGAMRQEPTPGPGVSLGPLSSYIGFQLRRAQDLSFQAFARRVGDHDLSPGQFAVLALIEENPGINQTLLSIATGRDKSTLTPSLKELERRKLVHRARSTADRRAYILNLTELGRAHLQALTRHAEAHDRLLDSLVGEVHKPLFLFLLEQIVEGLEAERTAEK